MSATCVSALCFVFLFVLMRFAFLLRADTQVRPYERRKPYRSDLISRGCPSSRWVGSGQAQGPVPTAPEAEKPSFRRMPESGIKVERSASGVSGSRMKTFRDDEQRRADT